MQHDISILALVKGKERYLYVYDDESRGALFDCIRDQAASPEMNLTWFDARILTERARRQATEAANQKSPKKG